jgi:hypothetical protein
MSIQLKDAAKYFDELPHQLEAWKWLQDAIPLDVLETFADKYREKPKEEEFNNDWEGVLAAATKAGAKFPEVVAAQWALESGWGVATSCNHNYFGIKSTQGDGCHVQTKEVYNGKEVTITDWFKRFASLYECIDYLVNRWYKDYRGYKGVNRAASRNECAQLLAKEGYATDPNYSTKLIQIMDQKLGTSGTTAKPTDPAQAQKFNPWSPFSYKVTPHITYGELTLGEESRRFIKQYQCDTAVELCRFLEKVRSQFGNKPIIITSGNRPPKVNQSIGGAKNSEHLYSGPDVGAVDFYIKGVDAHVVQDWCDKNWPYSLGYGADRGFVHLGMRLGKPRVRWDYA